MKPTITRLENWVLRKLLLRIIAYQENAKAPIQSGSQLTSVVGIIAQNGPLKDLSRDQYVIFKNGKILLTEKGRGCRRRIWHRLLDHV